MEFVLDEWKRIVIHEIIKYDDLEKLFKMRIAGVPHGGIIKPLLWADGVVFDRAPMPSTEEVIEKQLEGVIHWSSLEFAFMPKYENSVKVDGSILLILDVSSNKIFLEMADYLKKSFAI